jgi:pantothenate kinase-related protein Tda10
MRLLHDNPRQTDILGFAPIADTLYSVILDTPAPFTIGLFGGWGSGKTTLMHMVRKRLADAGGKTV